MALFSVSVSCLLFAHVSSSWVEITQSSNKKYLQGGPIEVAEYTPYIFTPSPVFDVPTTEKPRIVLPLSRPYPKKQINGGSNWNKTMVNIYPVKPTLIKSKLPPKNFHGYGHQAEAPPDIEQIDLDSAETIQEDVETEDNDEEEEEEEEEDEDDEDEYEMVYDDDEDGDNYDPDKDDFDDENQPTTSPQIEDEYYEDDEEEEYEDIEYEEESAPSRGGKQGKGHTEGNVIGFSYAKLIPYLKQIQSTLIRNAHVSTVESKVSFLSQIKDRLLQAIKTRINSIWSPWGAKRPKRTIRGDLWSGWGKAEHGMEFPSNEGALLTLGFLTFAAFLVKCVLKLMHTFKGKQHKEHKPVVMVNGSLGGNAALPLTFRLKREVASDAEFAWFMSRMESFTPH